MGMNMTVVPEFVQGKNPQGDKLCPRVSVMK